MPVNEWDSAIEAPALITKAAGCGENRFIGVKNYMDVFITPGCEFEIRRRDAVLTNIRIEWTVAEFYADGGTSTFADRVAAALGIHKSRVKVVAVYEGSVVVQYLIMAEVIDDNPDATIAEITQLITNKVLSAQYFVGGTILSTDFGSANGNIDILNPPSATITTASIQNFVKNRDSLSVTGVLTGLAMALGPAAIFMARTPKVREMVGELYGNDNTNIYEEKGTKTKGDRGEDDWEEDDDFDDNREGERKKGKITKDDDKLKDFEDLPTILASYFTW